MASACARMELGQRSSDPPLAYVCARVVVDGCSGAMRGGARAACPDTFPLSHACTVLQAAMRLSRSRSWSAPGGEAGWLPTHVNASRPDSLSSELRMVQPVVTRITLLLDASGYMQQRGADGQTRMDVVLEQVGPLCACHARGSVCARIGRSYLRAMSAGPHLQHNPPSGCHAQGSVCDGCLRTCWRRLGALAGRAILPCPACSNCPYVEKGGRGRVAARIGTLDLTTAAGAAAAAADTDAAAAAADADFAAAAFAGGDDAA
eukprot:352836-Chlamydomonas_euryale.AAC.12